MPDTSTPPAGFPRQHCFYVCLPVACQIGRIVSDLGPMRLTSARLGMDTDGTVWTVTDESSRIPPDPVH